jgi:Pycsar effector protein
MEKQKLFDVASAQLDRVLSFFPRVETKISALFAVDVAMLALLAVNATVDDLGIWYLALLYVASAVALGTSIWFLYTASFPQLKGGHNSLIYFKEIARRTEANYLKEMRETEIDAYADDMLGQVWRNSEILAAKFHGVKWSFICTAIAVPAWFLALASASTHHAQLVVR